MIGSSVPSVSRRRWVRKRERHGALSRSPIRRPARVDSWQRLATALRWPESSCSGCRVLYTFRLRIEKHDRSRYEWQLAGAGGVMARGAEPDITFCLAASAIGLVPDAPVAIEYCGASAGVYAARRLQKEPVAVSNDIMEAIAASRP